MEYPRFGKMNEQARTVHLSPFRADLCYTL